MDLKAATLNAVPSTASTEIQVVIDNIPTNEHSNVDNRTTEVTSNKQDQLVDIPNVNEIFSQETHSLNQVLIFLKISPKFLNLSFSEINNIPLSLAN